MSSESNDSVIHKESKKPISNPDAKNEALTNGTNDKPKRKYNKKPKDSNNKKPKALGKIRKIIGVTQNSDKEMLFCVKFENEQDTCYLTNSVMRENFPMDLANYYESKIVLFDAKE